MAWKAHTKKKKCQRNFQGENRSTHMELDGPRMFSFSLRTFENAYMEWTSTRSYLFGLLYGSQWRKDQERDLKNILKNTDQDIPLVFVSGNHDIGNTPTRETIDNYCKSWGDDYFSFWVGGVFFLVLNSQLYFDSSKCPELKQAQDVWLNEQLAVAEKHKCKHIIVFQHIPLFLREPDEDHDYFNLEKSVRQGIMEKFHKAGIKAVFSGHYHRNAGGSYRGLEMVVTSAIGCQLGEDTHGLRVVVVTDEKIVHRYYSLDELSSQGMEKELLDMLAKQN
ncbi:serine/threonine-protein phosphatase CPPED1 isoform X6 [Anser cygnoides]|uniref:serine/threonine-protein phosphatase CPPED1 isoform X6 n=1 Tax=Anser cygnoides TaxID=8845 RepID=UPI00067118DA|nr:serine/threonine-protein phosphatase CPPED1 isoform X4 [Anser cygnoides]